MFIRSMKIMLTILLLGIVVACSKGTELRSARTSDAATGPVNGTGVPTCAANAQTVGRVYDSGAASGVTFEQRVKGLLSASVDPQYFGTISGDANDANTGVTIQGRVSYDSAGNVIAGQTNLKLVVTDSYVGQKDATGAVVPAYPMNFAVAASGTVNVAAKTFTVLFKDSYGEITVTGSFAGAVTSGTITYTNYATVGPGGYPTSGTLGAFQISTCAWIQ